MMQLHSPDLLWSLFFLLQMNILVMPISLMDALLTLWTPLHHFLKKKTKVKKKGVVYALIGRWCENRTNNLQFFFVHVPWIVLIPKTTQEWDLNGVGGAALQICIMASLERLTSSDSLGLSFPTLRSEECDFMFKIVVIGDSGVGKTCALKRFRYGTYSERHANTIGVDFTLKTVEVEGKIVQVYIFRWLDGLMWSMNGWS